MDKAKVNLTKEGHAKLLSQLEELKSRREPTVQRLQLAREQGDLSENGAYKAARFELSDIDRNIRRIENLLKNATVFERNGQSEIVEFGSIVLVSNGGKKTEYYIVSQHESDPVTRKLSQESPLGTALMGHKVGEQVVVNAPAGRQTYKILKIS